MPYAEQAQIPEIVNPPWRYLSYSRYEVDCPNCSKRSVGFETAMHWEDYPPWCLCGWNVKETRKRIWANRATPCAFLGILSVFLLIGYAMNGGPLPRGTPFWFGAYLAVMCLLLITQRCNWMAAALAHARGELRHELIAWHGPDPRWQPVELELRQPPPRRVKARRSPPLESAFVAVILAGALLLVVFTAFRATGAQHWFPWALALAACGVVAAVWNQNAGIRRLLEEGHVAAGIIVSREYHAGGKNQPEYWVCEYLFVDQNGRRYKGRFNAYEHDWGTVPKETDLISILYMPPKPEASRPYLVLPHRAAGPR